MANIGPGTWFVTGLLLLGFAVYSLAQGWQHGLLWKLLGGAGLVALLVGYYRRGAAAGALPPSAGADYRPSAPGLPTGDKLPLGPLSPGPP